MIDFAGCLQLYCSPLFIIKENNRSCAAQEQHREGCFILRRIYIYRHHSCALLICDFNEIGSRRIIFLPNF